MTTADFQKATREFAASLGITLRAGGLAYAADGTPMEHEGKKVRGYTALCNVLVALGYIGEDGRLTRKGKTCRTRAEKMRAQASNEDNKASDVKQRMADMARQGMTARKIAAWAHADGVLQTISERAHQRAQAGHWNLASTVVARILTKQQAPVLYATARAARAAIARGEPGAGWAGGEPPRFAPPDDNPEPPKRKGGKRKAKAPGGEQAHGPARTGDNTTVNDLVEALGPDDSVRVLDLIQTLLSRPRSEAKRVDRQRRAEKGETGT